MDLSRRNVMLGGASATALAALPSGASDALRTEAVINSRRVANDDTDLLEQWVRDFEEAELASREARYLAEKARDFYDGAQWTPEEIAQLRKRHQPPSVNNLIKGKIDLLSGLERRGRSDPKAFPRTPAEDMRADAATQALRYIADDQRYDVVRSSAFENILIEGVGGIEVLVEQDEVSGGYNVRINHVPWNRIFYDPHSQHPGFSDAMYLGVVIWMDRDDAMAMYPGSEAVLETTFASGATMSGSFDDRPNMWCDSRRRRVRLVQMHRKRGNDWWTGTFTRGGFLDGPQPSPYLDRHGRPTCPLILRSAYTDRHNNRYGVVRDLIPKQEAINKTESKLQHMLAVNQIEAEDGAFADVDVARREAAKPDGVIIRNRGFEGKINRDSGAVQGQFERLQYQIGQMRDSGPNASLSGKDPRELSGRAIIAQQSGGQTEHEPIADAMRQLTHKVFEAAWMRVRQFWTGPKWIRVTDDDRDVKFVGLNNPVTLGDQIKKLVESDPQKAQAVIQQLGITGPTDPRLQTVLRVENDLDDLDVDITIEEGPDVPTIQNEQWQAFTQLPESVLSQFPPEFFIKANPSIRDKDQLIGILEKHQAAQAASQQAQQSFQSAMQQAQLGKVQADTADRTAQAQDRQAQSVVRLHGVAVDHAAMQQVPVAPPGMPPGLGPVGPDQNTLMQPSPTANSGMTNGIL